MNSVARRKRVEIEARGYLINGVAFIHPTTGRRGLLDNLGAVHWIALETPAKPAAVSASVRDRLQWAEQLLAEVLVGEQDDDQIEVFVSGIPPKAQP